MTPAPDDSNGFEKEFGDKEVAGILNKFKAHASSTLLFLSSVEDVSFPIPKDVVDFNVKKFVTRGCGSSVIALLGCCELAVSGTSSS